MSGCHGLNVAINDGEPYCRTRVGKRDVDADAQALRVLFNRSNEWRKVVFNIGLKSEEAIQQHYGDAEFGKLQSLVVTGVDGCVVETQDCFYHNWRLPILWNVEDT